MQPSSSPQPLPGAGRPAQVVYAELIAPAGDWAAGAAQRAALIALGFRPVGLLEARFAGDPQAALLRGSSAGLSLGPGGAIREVLASPDGTAAAALEPRADGGALCALFTLLGDGAIVETTQGPPGLARTPRGPRLPGGRRIRPRGDRPAARYHAAVFAGADLAGLWAEHRRRVAGLSLRAGARPADHGSLRTMAAIGLRAEQILADEERLRRAIIIGLTLLVMGLWVLLFLPPLNLYAAIFGSGPYPPDITEQLLAQLGLVCLMMLGLPLMHWLSPRLVRSPLVPAEELRAAVRLGRREAAPGELAPPRPQALPPLLPRSRRRAGKIHRDVSAAPDARLPPPSPLRADLVALGFRPVGLLETRLAGDITPAQIAGLFTGPQREQMRAALERGEVDELLVSPDGAALAVVERWLGGQRLCVLYTLLERGAVVETVMRPAAPLRFAPMVWPFAGRESLWPREDRPRSHYHLALVATDAAPALWAEHRRRVATLLQGPDDRAADHASLRALVAISLRAEQLVAGERWLRVGLLVGLGLPLGGGLVALWGLIIVAALGSFASPSPAGLALLGPIPQVIALAVILGLTSLSLPLSRRLTARLARSPLVPARELLAAARLADDPAE